MSISTERAGRRPTIKAVAAAAGVSTAAVSQAFNNKGRLSEATRRRILDAALELGWSPSASAARCATPAPAVWPSWCGVPRTCWA